jgi:hypothetical protein
MTNQPEVAQTGCSERKHIGIDNAIEHLSTISNHLEELKVLIVGGRVEEVKDPETPKLAAPPRRDPELIEVLNSGAARIYDRTEEIHSQISDIVSLLT